MADAARNDEGYTESAKPKPFEEIRYGNTKTPIWRNHGENGDFFTAGTPQIRYLDKKNEWQTSSSHSAGDLLMMARAMEKTADRLVELNAKARGQSR